MLRLTRIPDAHAVEIIKLEGKLVEPWVEEVRGACPASGGPRRLDLSAITFVDAAGEQLLRELLRQGVEVVACSGYIAELLRSSAAGPLSGQQ
jgi:hypothetical protein